MPTPFPGMDPYLERRGLWEEIHTDLISGIRHYLIPLLRPKYRVAIEQRTYLSLVSSSSSLSLPFPPPKPELTGKPDVMITIPGQAAVAEPLTLAETTFDPPLLGELPMPEEITERYLEIRDVGTQEVITAIEILSPTNKTDKEGQQQYERKRLQVLGSETSLVEIDLLRGGQPFAMRVIDQNQATSSDYRIVISRSWQRPSADLYLFGVRQPIPSFLIPLRPSEQEPVLPLNRILHDLYDQGGFDMVIDYTQPADPPLAEADALWAAQLRHR